LRTLWAWCGEPLEKHLLDTLKEYMKIFEARLVCVLSSRLGIKDKKIQEFLKFAVRVTIGFHDIGKAHPSYWYWNKDKVRAECPFDGDCRKCEGNKPSFRGHEIVSAWIVKEYLDKLEYLANLQQLTSRFPIGPIAWLAVAQHHQGMRAIDDVNVDFSKERKKWTKWNPLNDENTKIIVESLLENALQGISFLSFNEILDELRGIEINFGGNIRSSHTQLKLYALLAGPLMISDNLVALRNRKGRHLPQFLKEALKFLALGQNSPLSP